MAFPAAEHEITGVILRFFRRNQDLKTTVSRHLQCVAIQGTGIDAGAGFELHKATGIPGVSAGQFKDDILGCARPGHGCLASPVPAIQATASHQVALVAIDLRPQVDRIAVINGGAVHGLDGATKAWITTGLP